MSATVVIGNGGVATASALSGAATVSFPGTTVGVAGVGGRALVWDGNAVFVGTDAQFAAWAPSAPEFYVWVRLLDDGTFDSIILDGGAV